MSDTSLDTAASSDAALYQGLRISEIMPGNKTAVPDEEGLFSDWVEVWNSTDRDISLKGVGLSDDGRTIKFIFPDVTLAADERVIVFCTDTNLLETGKPYHAKFKLSSSGETVYLYTPNAYAIDSVTYPIMSSDTSWSLVGDEFQEVTWYSPTYENSEEGHQAYLLATMVTEGDLIINEVMADAKSGLSDEDGEFSDWIELYNTTDSVIDLSNYALSDKENKPMMWRFPDGAVIAPHSYYIVFCSGKDRRDDPSAIPHSSFKLSAEHDTVVLSDAKGRIVDRVTIDNLAEDCSYARGNNGVFSVHTMATPGRANDDISGADYDLRARNTTGVIITEVMASNSTVTVYEGVDTKDWIELYNSSSQTVDLSGYGLSDNIGRARRWQFPEGTVILPGAYLTVMCDGENTTTASTILHTNFKIKRAGGETICLSTPDGHVLDKIVLPAIPTDVSYGRTNDLSGFFYYETPTPNAANGLDGFRGYADRPELLQPAGLYEGTVYTGFTIPEGCSVYYTTDGSIPTRDSTLYRGETLELNFTTVLRARAYSDSEDTRPSEIVTGSYFVNTYHSLPIVSVTVDPDELWNETDGMLVAGTNVDKSSLPFKNTIYREFGKIPREGYVEYFLLDGTQVLSQGMEVALQGDYSLDMPQKSLKLRAKSKYGAKTFAAALFDDRPYTEYKGFTLRNSGNDCVWTRLLDGFESRLIDSYGTIVAHQAWNPVVVYINGVYWGHYNMRERKDKYFVAQHEGLSFDEADDITILKGNMALVSGSSAVRTEYKNMIAKIKKSDPANNEEDLQYILDNVDVDNYFEYIAFEMFFGNSDIGNMQMYRVPGGKWKWLLYDLDYGLFNSTFDSAKSYTKDKGMGQKNIDNTILKKLLTVPEYKDKFLRKLGDIFQTFTTEYMLSVLEPLVDLIEPEMSMHFARWGEENDTAIIAELPTTSDGAYRYWEKRVERLRNVIKKRPNLLWGYIQDAFNLSNAEMLDYFGERPEMPADAI